MREPTTQEIAAATEGILEAYRENRQIDLPLFMRRAVEAGVKLARGPAPLITGLTKQQQAVLVYIANHIEAHGVSPSYQEIMVGVGLKSKSRIYEMVKALKERGAIRKVGRKVRSLDVLVGVETR